jgi:DNA-binding XRE family transcriptional regulator
MLSEELKIWRIKNNYSQRQLAKALGVTNITISRWERGEREIPSFLHLALKPLKKKGGGIKVGRPAMKREAKDTKKGRR